MFEAEQRELRSFKRKMEYKNGIFYIANLPEPGGSAGIACVLDNHRKRHFAGAQAGHASL